MTTTAQKPRIAIPVPTSYDREYNERCWPEFAAAVEASEGEPVRVLLTGAPAETASLLSSCSAILLPGSPADVQPQKYGEEPLPATETPDAGREAIDELLLQDAFNLRKPILGVCFGLQMMNVWRGGSLRQSLPSGHAPGSDKKPLEHRLHLNDRATLLRRAYQAQAEPAVNSSHHQAVGNAGDGLIVAATAVEDGTIEALEGIDCDRHFVLGVQWHPERMFKRDEPSKLLFTQLIAAAARWRLPAE